VVCSDFIAQYAVNGTTFPCFASRTDPKLVVVDLDLQQVHAELFYSLAVPVPCLVVACIYIVIAYIYIYKDQETVRSLLKSLRLHCQIPVVIL
jgi:Na+-translocating ferredoxin:NAD+ oxidoreductase RnfE subunit